MFKTSVKRICSRYKFPKKWKMLLAKDQNANNTVNKVDTIYDIEDTHTHTQIYINIYI